MDRTVRRLATALLAISLVILGVVVPVHIVSFNLEFYQSEWEKQGVPADTGMSMPDLTRSASALLDYFTGKAPTPQVEVAVHDRVQPLYNSKELTHLEDVKKLFGFGFTLEQVLLAEALGICLYFVKSGNRRTLSRALLTAGGVTLGIFAALAIPARMDFSGFWTDFHLLTFTNELWLLNPATDWLVRIYPEGFFLSAVTRIGIIASGVSFLYLLLGLFVRNLAADHRH